MSKNRRRQAPARGRHGTVRNVPLRTHWLLLTTLVLTLSAALLLQGYTRHMFDSTADGAPRGQRSAAAVPVQIASGGPVIEGAAGRTAGPAARTIALTFDDGPDPVWTPKILDVLRRNGVRATFFTVGTRVAENPGLARRIVEEGHQIGLHSFTHTDLGSASPWRRSLELRETQLTIAGATGVTTPLLRPPYSSGNDALTDPDWDAVVQAGQEGYLTVLTTLDSEDWRRPGVARIIANATPPGTGGQILLMHDAGGDRSQTVAALEQLLPRVKAAGFTFSTVGDAVALPTAVQPARTAEHWQGLALITALRTSDGILERSPGCCGQRVRSACCVPSPCSSPPGATYGCAADRGGLR
ncbi:polysaccharide deacetylase family protein [Streptomyces sp. G-G2]|uniref:polysaccharide deacetylase family protein n=1 Tax=Streptomyces sp. G-G2 TaxID=3046201 RepID=UPI0032D93CC7